MGKSFKELVTSIKQQGNLVKHQRPAIIDRENQLSVWREWAGYEECLKNAIQFHQQRKLDRFLDKENATDIAALKAALFPRRWASFFENEHEENNNSLQIFA